jgi:hypothetical protein
MIKKRLVGPRVKDYLDDKGIRYSYIATSTGIPILKFLLFLFGLGDIRAEQLFYIADELHILTETFNPFGAISFEACAAPESGEKSLYYNDIYDFTCYLTGEHPMTVGICPSADYASRFEALIKEVAGDRLLEYESKFIEILSEVEDTAYNYGFRAALKLLKAIFSL